MSDAYVEKQKKEYYEELHKALGLLPIDFVEGIDLIVDLAITKAAEKAVNAGFSGAWNDGGGRASLDAVIKFIVGARFAQTGKLLDVNYSKLLREHNIQQDSEYKEYLRLKHKFVDF